MSLINQELNIITLFFIVKFVFLFNFRYNYQVDNTLIPLYRQQNVIVRLKVINS